MEQSYQKDQDDELELEGINEDGPLLGRGSPRTKTLAGQTELDPPLDKVQRQRQRRRRCYIIFGVVILGCLLIIGLFLPSPTSSSELSRYAEKLEWESQRARDMLLRNIGPRVGANDGLVVASPSRGESEDLPDYYYTWTRDSALVYKTLNTLDSSFPSNLSQFDELLLRDYVQSQLTIQNTANPSGGLDDGGLNEPKFQVDGKPFVGDWGRPQRDGPALRVLALIPYAHFLLDRAYPADLKYVQDNLYDPDQIMAPGKVVKNDLEEVSHGWSKSGFDLWEEVNGHHFFTLIVSLRALQAGSSLAYRLNDTGAELFYSEQADSIAQKLKVFWNDEKQYYLSTIPSLRLDGDNTPTSLPEREWLDCSIPLSLIHAGDHIDLDGYGQYNMTIPVFSATNPEVISTLHRYILSFDGLYKINGNIGSWTQGWALGRYREDVYDGVRKSKANPWHICTNAIAQSFYIMEAEHRTQGYIDTTESTKQFWNQALRKTVKPGRRYGTGGKSFEKALKRLREIGDRYLDVSRDAMDGEGWMSEQIGRNDGKPRGARDLTWSYASFMSAVKAREEAMASTGNEIVSR
ncbi:hypothetical protein I302_109084 [Kwoniella bestiolae CBS 10118]|uniref:glucan 1,4-alpha-glucosidase n=1 Tax=Kwoniella bestiolae CBS 10118 TaxID=1296100 RepID=A0A1B9FUZ3_9TREE|nr:hypothetical protein I302_08228 [Kwoniella bestiolae CBS 10118]OCF22578.1 hypothetical protein I302_08228 [Kwoniella bestiolae CBS 10118]